jgi:hypothetical protein
MKYTTFCGEIKGDSVPSLKKKYSNTFMEYMYRKCSLESNGPYVLYRMQRA